MTARQPSPDDRPAPSGLASAPPCSAREAVADDAERRLARLYAELDGTGLLLVRLDAGGRVVYANAAWRDFVRGSGGRAEPIDGNARRHVELTRHVSQPAARATARVLASLPDLPGEASTAEFSCDVDRALRWFRLDGRRLEDGVLLAHTDITEQRRAEAELRIMGIVSRALAERQPFVSACRLLMEATCETLDWDFAGVWVPNDWNELVCANFRGPAHIVGSEFENLTRTTSFERGKGLPGQAWLSQVPLWIDDLAAADQFPRLQRGRAIGLKSGFAVPICRDGQLLAVLEVFSCAKRREDQRLIDFLATAGSQLGQEELRVRTTSRGDPGQSAVHMTKARLDAILEHAPGFIIAVDPTGRIQFINRVFPHHRRDDVIGSDWLRHVPASEHAALMTKLQELLATGAPQRHEMRMDGADGRQVWLSAHLAPTRENGVIVGAVTSVQDVTDLKHAQLEIAATQRWVSVGTLAAGVAHEVNTPVQFVNDNLHFIRDAARRLLGLAQKLGAMPHMLLDGASEAQLRDAATVALRAVQAARLPFLEQEVPKAVDACIEGISRVTTIVESLKELAQPAGAEMEEADLNRVIERSLTIATSEYRYVAELQTDLGELPPVRCLVSEIGQVVLNLVVNAAHAISDVVRGTDQKGTLEIRTWREQDQAVIAIRDTGTGIPEEIRPRIFDPFFTTKEVGKGTGQGLALAWAVIKQKHDGSLTFESTVGEGTTFFIRLPIVRSSPRVAAEAARSRA